MPYIFYVIPLPAYVEIRLKVLSMNLITVPLFFRNSLFIHNFAPLF